MLPEYDGVAELESPILILRHYDLTDNDDPFSPVSTYIPEEMRVAVHGLGVDMPAVDAEALRIWCRTEAQAEDVWQIFGPLWGMPRGPATLADDGFYTTVSIFPSPDTSLWGILFLQSRLLFGQYIAI